LSRPCFRWWRITGDFKDAFAHSDDGRHHPVRARINALEAIATQAVFDRANLEADPFQWVQDLIKSIEVTKNALIPHADDPSKGERLKKETVIALDEFLEGLVEKSGNLRVSPSQRPQLARCNRWRRRIQHTTVRASYRRIGSWIFGGIDRGSTAAKSRLS
jgi:hypothetical protein